MRAGPVDLGVQVVDDPSKAAKANAELYAGL
jgi:hypothetical protein